MVERDCSMHEEEEGSDGSCSQYAPLTDCSAWERGSDCEPTKPILLLLRGRESRVYLLNDFLLSVGEDGEVSLKGHAKEV